MLSCHYDYLQRSSGAVAERISLAEAKLFLRVDYNDDDLLISEMIVSARIHAEHYIASALVEQEWTVHYPDFSAKELVLPMSPALSITSITSYDASYAPTIIASLNYQLVLPYKLIFINTINAHMLKIVYRTSPKAHNDMALKHAMLHHIALCYEMRSSSAPLPAQSRDIYASYKKVRV
ncbi:MAG: hypothetical protein EAZ52_04135 [Alphaproteobacteria bacterium]|nr:MAG: hypothetical protein EAZ52_04135 [Alphaproteobacteria bacterium]